MTRLQHPSVYRENRATLGTKGRFSSLAFLSPLIRILILILTSNIASAHFDAPGPPALTDLLELRSLRFNRSFDDGTFIGDDESEICIRLKWTHSDHSLGGGDPGEPALQIRCFEDVDMGPDQPTALDPPFVLVGSGGVQKVLASPPHDECTPSASWQLDMEVREMDSGIAAVISLIGSAVDLASKAGVLGDITNLNVSEEMEEVGAKMEAILGKEMLVGGTVETFNAGDGDPTGEVTLSENFGTNDAVGFTLVKSVEAVPGGDANCTPPLPPPPVEPTGCFEDDHPFTKNKEMGELAYRYVDEAIDLINSLEVETGETISVPINELKALARELAALVARMAAALAVSEASLSPFVSPQLLDQTEGLLSSGDALRDVALVNGNTAQLRQANAQYKSAFGLLAPALHPACVRVQPPATNTIPVMGPWMLLLAAALLLMIAGLWTRHSAMNRLRSDR